MFRAFHAGHHRHPEPSPFAGFAFDPLEALLTGWFLPALVFVIPMEVHLAVVLLLVVTTVTGTLNHGGWEVWPRRWVEGGVRPLGGDPQPTTASTTPATAATSASTSSTGIAGSGPRPRRWPTPPGAPPARGRPRRSPRARRPEAEARPGSAPSAPATSARRG